jgi:hypothetical protein
LFIPQATKTVSVSQRPAPPPSNRTVDFVSESESARKITPATVTPTSDFSVTTAICIFPALSGGGDPEDCDGICNFFAENPNVAVTIPPLEILTFSLGTCVFEILNRDVCGDIDAVYGEFVQFCEPLNAQCVANGFDGLINGEDPPAMMTLAGVPSAPAYTADGNCNDAHNELRRRTI